MIVHTSIERIHLGDAVSGVYVNNPISSLDGRLKTSKNTDIVKKRKREEKTFTKCRAKENEKKL